MSGCVNCVWDRYRDELEEWAAKTAEARRRLLLAQSGQVATASQQAGGVVAHKTPASMHASTSMDDDGGGSETNWEVDLNSPQNPEELFADIPVGIREFMRVEKMLREKRRKEMQL